MRKTPTLVFYFLVCVLSVTVSWYSEGKGFDRGMRAAIVALEPHLCK